MSSSESLDGEARGIFKRSANVIEKVGKSDISSVVVNQVVKGSKEPVNAAFDKIFDHVIIGKRGYGY